MRHKHSTPTPRPCRVCGITFTPRQNRPERGMYCSRACKGVASRRDEGAEPIWRTAIERVCPECGKAFMVWPARARDGRGHYCSKACLNAAQFTRVPLICAHCGKQFMAERHRLKHGVTYCSHTCAKAGMVGPKAARWRGGVRRYIAYKDSPERRVRNSTPYKLWRRAVLARDGRRCRNCGAAGKRLHTHHILPFAKHEALRLDPNNGITLCDTCHYEVGGREYEYVDRFTALVGAAR